MYGLFSVKGFAGVYGVVQGVCEDYTQVEVVDSPGVRQDEGNFRRDAVRLRKSQLFTEQDIRCGVSGLEGEGQGVGGDAKGLQIGCRLF